MPVLDAVVAILLVGCSAWALRSTMRRVHTRLTKRRQRKQAEQRARQEDDHSSGADACYDCGKKIDPEVDLYFNHHWWHKACRDRLAR